MAARRNLHSENIKALKNVKKAFFLIANQRKSLKLPSDVSLSKDCYGTVKLCSFSVIND